MGDKSMSCGEPVRLPSSTVLAIPKGMPVMIGGPPAISIMDAVGALLRSKWVAGYMHDLLSRMKPGRLRNLLSKGVCFLTGHPVDVATGRVLTDNVDWQLPGPPPLKFERNYSSAWAGRDGPLGHGWSHTLDQAVWVERGKIVYLDGEGRELELDIFDFPDHVLPVGHEVFDAPSRLTLKSLGARRYQITNHGGMTYEFAPVAGAGGARASWSRLVRQVARDGRTIALEYDARGNLAWVHDSAGRAIAFEHDRAGRLVATKLPHPTEKDAWQVHTRYAYDAAGDLVQATDPLGHSWRFTYKGHLLVQETNRNGLSFYFAYDGYGEDAYCVRTWGDGGIYDHIIDYDKIGKVTCVTNSLGRTSTYKMNPVGCVVKVTDPLGGATAYEYDERTLWKVKETDAMGGETTWQHDARGNVTKVTGPDGATVAIDFDAHNLPVRAVDALGGEWTWGYDERGRLIGRMDSLGRRVQFHWGSDTDVAAARGPATRRDGAAAEPARLKRLASLTDPSGQDTSLHYDGDGNVTSLRTPDGAISRWRYDRLGRCTAALDATGNVQQREHDALGRVVRVVEPDGNVRELAYDPEGNVVTARDQQHDVRFTYQGMGRISSRTEAGTRVGFVYDTEERLTAIENEHGHVYKFQLDAAGRVEVESGFDGIRRQYARDKAGRVAKVFRPASRETKYAYDPASRVVGVEHSDGSAEAYAYRKDGELVEAKNDAATVKLERDLLGRVVRETIGEGWIASEYNALGMRVRLRSSKGLGQRIERNAVGQMTGVRAAVARAPAGDDGAGAQIADGNFWEARVARDLLGLEIERQLPGGVRARWQRDAVGRPTQQEITVAGEFRRAVHYTWEVNDRLRMVVDAARGPVRYEHDALGNLAAATYEDGGVDLRMPDAVGNLFRTQARTDRKYGPAGQLLESREPDGRLVTYDYDPEGNLVRKTEVDTAPQSLASATPAPGLPVPAPRPRGEGTGEGPPAPPQSSARVWTYHWNAAGMLTQVVRSDGETVTFTYDALARRLSKTFRARTTKWIWDGNLPLHEWVEGRPIPHPSAHPALADVAVLDELAVRRRRFERAAKPSQGPPDDSFAAPQPNTPAVPVWSTGATEPGTAEDPITWLFDPESFAPMAKLVGDARYAIITDHLGTPTAMYDAAGAEVWSATIDAYGDLRNITGTRTACPFRWPGQYEDAETGLYYNRFRYYDPTGGSYISKDPLRIRAGLKAQGYVPDPLRALDPYGLINPFDILFSQDSVSHEFSDGPWKGRCITEAIEEAKALGHLPEGLELNVMRLNDEFVTLNNRTLLVAQEAGLLQVHPHDVGPRGFNKLNQLLEGRPPQREQPIVGPCKK